MLFSYRVKTGCIRGVVENLPGVLLRPIPCEAFHSPPKLISRPFFMVSTYDRMFPGSDIPVDCWRPYAEGLNIDDGAAPSPRLTVGSDVKRGIGRHDKIYSPSMPVRLPVAEYGPSQ